MEIDLILDARADANLLCEQGLLAEELGFSGVWVSSLLDGRDPYATMMPLALASQVIRMGAIAVNPWDIHPVKISAALHTLNEASAGRARIVIGGGGEALASLGLRPDRRVRAVHECVEIIRMASKGERFDYVGQLYQAAGYSLPWLQAPPPEVYVAANMPQMLRMAGRVAAGVMLSDLPPALATQAVATAKESAQHHARSASELWFSSFTAWHVYDDAKRARREAARWMLLRGLFRPWVLETFLDAGAIELVMSSQQAFVDAFVAGTHEIKGVPDEVVDLLIDNLTLTGSLDDIPRLTQHLLAYKQAGLSSVSLRLYEEPDATMRKLAEQVLPALRSD